MRARGTTSGSTSSTSWRSGIGGVGIGAARIEAGRGWRAADDAPRQAADVHEPERGRPSGLLQFYKIERADLLVVVDDVNLELGRLRARAAGSAGGHNGLKSVIGALGTDAFARLRIGVGRGEPRRDLADHVLARFDPDEGRSLPRR